MSPARNSEPRHDRWVSVLLSVLVHAGVVAMLGWGWWRFRAPKPAPQQLAIEATVVAATQTTVAPAPEEHAAEEREQTELRQQAERREQEQREARAQEDRQRAEERQRVEEQQRTEEQRRVAEQQRAEDQARRERERQEREAAARKIKEAADLAAREKAQRAAEDKARRETELRAQLAAEERINAARGSAEEAAWLAQIRDRVTRAWIRPPSVRVGVNCEVRVTQVPGGVVTAVQIGACNGDQAVRESIEAAVYRASPLPTPTNPDVFDRSLIFNFHPDE